MKILIRMIIFALILVIAFLILMMYSIAKDFGLAEGSYEDQAWALCNPDGIVNIRSKPKKTSREIAGVECGTHLKTDGTVKNGYLHVYGIAAEETEGWISTRYIVWYEPVLVDIDMYVVSDGRVACRKNIDGKIKSWLKNGDILHVYWYSAEWAVTDRGYVMSCYLEPLSQELQTP